MKELLFDQYEFKHWEGEESLRIVIQDKLVRGVPHETLDEFLERAWHHSWWCNYELSARPVATPFSELPPGHFIDYLQRFAMIEPKPFWSYFVFDDDWNDQVILIDSPQRHILYQWMTSA